ncbi:response regulator transcription factor [Oceanobacillus salinisoli]|uniref:response regulator transcription factor n=1 Tax=Oceanobacillus salinisoli TaxID=2678611 RepID=UPI0012E10C18|nr:response regulator transcription factor [Oceanobacillus salinisoli]
MIDVVVVENRQLFLDGTIALLEKEDDIQVVGKAMNYEQAVQQIQEKHVDVVVVDTDMPVDDGFKTITFIKKNFPHMKILVLTAVMYEEQVLRALCNGVDGYLISSQFAGKLAPRIREIIFGETFFSGDVARRLEMHGYQLTKREIDIAYLLLQKYTNQQISNKLYIS